ncbi:MAG: lectin-like protein, partial [Myxococcota bacterium]|nr:lectin-like protein [Myxococcota bacterium]
QLRKLGMGGNALFVPRLRADGRDNLRSLINAEVSRTGVTAHLDGNRSLVLTARDGRNIELRTVGMATNLGFPAGESLFRGALTLASEHMFALNTTVEGAASIGFGDTNIVHRTTALTSRDYLFCDDELSFDDAQQRCTELGGNLVGLQSLSESQWLAARRGTGEPSWVGHQNVNGRWVRTDGQRAGAILVEPDAAQGDGCALLVPLDASWQTVDCGAAHPFICAL